VELLLKEKLSVRQACKLVKMPRSVFRYTNVPKDDQVLETIGNYPYLPTHEVCHRSGILKAEIKYP
jgi:hypothetical protein